MYSSATEAIKEPAILFEVEVPNDNEVGCDAGVMQLEAVVTEPVKGLIA